MRVNRESDKGVSAGEPERACEYVCAPIGMRACERTFDRKSGELFFVAARGERECAIRVDHAPAGWAIVMSIGGFALSGFCTRKMCRVRAAYGGVADNFKRRCERSILDGNSRGDSRYRERSISVNISRTINSRVSRSIESWRS